MSRCVHGYLKRLCPLCKPKRSNPEMSWEYIGAFINAEGSASAFMFRGYLHTVIHIPQRNKVRKGYQLLENIRNFIKTETGIEGRIYLERPPDIYALTYHRKLEAYKLATIILPYLKHPHKIGEFIRFLQTIEYDLRNRIKRLPEQIRREKERHRKSALIGSLKTAQRELAQIQKIKQKRIQGSPREVLDHHASPKPEGRQTARNTLP